MTVHRGRRILLVDDEPYFAKYYNMALQHAGFDVCLVGNPDDALQDLSSIRSDIVVLDMMMPPGQAYASQDHHGGLQTGLLLLHDVRRILPDAGIIILSNIRNPKTLEGIGQQANIRFVSKVDCSPVRLVELVREFLSRSDTLDP
jgi:DNA-binding NarL/FixJ family response regulator